MQFIVLRQAFYGGDDSIISLFIILSATAYYDCRYERIPNRLIIAGVVTGSIFLGIHGEGSIQIHIFLAGVILLSFYPFFIFGALGAGDVKLFALSGLFLLPKQLLYSLFLAFLIAAGLVMIRFLQNKISTHNNIPFESTKRIHLALPFLLGVMIQCGGSIL